MRHLVTRSAHPAADARLHPRRRTRPSRRATAAASSGGRVRLPPDRSSGSRDPTSGAPRFEYPWGRTGLRGSTAPVLGRTAGAGAPSPHRPWRPSRSEGVVLAVVGASMHPWSTGDRRSLVRCVALALRVQRGPRSAAGHPGRVHCPLCPRAEPQTRPVQSGTRQTPAPSARSKDPPPAPTHPRSRWATRATLGTATRGGLGAAREMPGAADAAAATAPRRCRVRLPAGPAGSGARGAGATARPQASARSFIRSRRLASIRTRPVDQA